MEEGQWPRGHQDKDFSGQKDKSQEEMQFTCFRSERGEGECVLFHQIPKC